jgi:hypothetical protein
MLGLNDRISIRDGAVPAKAAEETSQEKAAQEKAAQEKAAQEKAAQGKEEKPTQEKPAQGAAPSDAAAASQPAVADGTAQHPVPGRSYDFHTDLWAELYVKRIDAMIAALKSKGVPVLWVGLPALRGAKSTSDMAYLDELYRERAERAGIYYVDIWDGFTDDQGRYAVDGPDFEGQIRRLRTADGVHFTKAGAVKLASYVDQELHRVMSTHVAPIALPEQASPAKLGAPRPDVGPVLPLTVSSTGDGGAGGLLGAGNQPAPLASDPLAQKVLDRGAPIAAAAGRADDFTWPRPQAPADVAPQPLSLSPAEPAKKGVAHDDVKKPADAKKDAKKKPEKDSDAVKDRGSPHAQLDGAQRPPKDIGGGF